MSSRPIIKPGPRRQGVMLSKTDILLKFAELRKSTSTPSSSSTTTSPSTSPSSSSSLSTRRSHIPNPLATSSSDAYWTTLQRDLELAERLLRSHTKPIMRPGYSKGDEDAELEQIQRFLMDPRDEFPDDDEEAENPFLYFKDDSSEEERKVGILRFVSGRKEDIDEWDFCEEFGGSSGGGGEGKKMQDVRQVKRYVRAPVREVKTLMCPLCVGGAPIHRDDFGDHIRTVHPLKGNVVCLVCGKKYDDEWRLKAHSQVHATEAYGGGEARVPRR